MKLGEIVFCNSGGIGIQTRRLAYMLKPDRLLAIDSSGFSKIKEQHFDWYDGFSGYRVNGFPKDNEIRVFLRGLTHVVCVENPLNYNLTVYAKRMGIKVFVQFNYEFCDFLNHQLTPPYKFLSPSYWHLGEMQNRFGKDNVVYLPPPIDPNEFKEARETNFNRHGQLRFLHIVGTLAAHDRNGTLDLLEALKHTKSDFELIIHSQQELPPEYMVNDNRVKYLMRSLDSSCDLYKDFDALIMPRRYGGLCLPVNEALMSGLPVLMTDTSPNNEWLPKEWLFKCQKSGEFMTRTMIDIYKSDIRDLAKKIDWLCQQNQDELKIQAFDLGYNNFSETVLLPKYKELFV
jgi:glycosyltransferase involved in cell wall biosynthesis